MLVLQKVNPHFLNNRRVKKELQIAIAVINFILINLLIKFLLQELILIYFVIIRVCTIAIVLII